jgi:hypothetical protein
MREGRYDEIEVAPAVLAALTLTSKAHRACSREGNPREPHERGGDRGMTHNVDYQDFADDTVIPLHGAGFVPPRRRVADGRLGRLC